MKNNKRQAFWLADNFRLWRSWITQQIPILKNGGSNPFERAKYKNRRRKVCGFLFFCIRYSNPAKSFLPIYPIRS